MRYLAVLAVQGGFSLCCYPTGVQLEEHSTEGPGSCTAPSWPRMELVAFESSNAIKSSTWLQTHSVIMTDKCSFQNNKRGAG